MNQWPSQKDSVYSLLNRTTATFQLLGALAHSFVCFTTTEEGSTHVQVPHIWARVCGSVSGIDIGVIVAQRLRSFTHRNECSPDASDHTYTARYHAGCDTTAIFDFIASQYYHCHPSPISRISIDSSVHQDIHRYQCYQCYQRSSRNHLHSRRNGEKQVTERIQVDSEFDFQYCQLYLHLPREDGGKVQREDEERLRLFRRCTDTTCIRASRSD